MDEHTKVTPEPQNPLQGLLSNPALLEALGGLMSKSTPPQGDAPKDSESVATVSADPQAFSDGISRVLADPEMMAKLPQMMELIKPMLTSNQGAAESVPAHAEHTLSREARCRNDLLLALKPFLSHERAAAVDAILRLSHLGNVLQTLK